jgi:MFS family permease
MSDANSATDTPALPKTSYAPESFGLLALVVVVAIIASTLAQTGELGKLPLANILKNKLHKSASEVASFRFYVGIFWYLKPLAGILTDAFPLLGTRRRYYLLFSSALAAAGWIGIGLVPHTFKALLLAAIGMNLFMVMISTVAGALVVEIGQSRGEVGKITAIRQITFNACGLIQGPIGGMLATLPFLLAAGANAAVVFSIFPVAYFFLKEKPTAARNHEAFTNAKKQLGVIGASGTFWMAILFIALFYFAPGFKTLLYYKQGDVLHLSQQNIGWLDACLGLGGVLAAFTYVFLARRISLQALIAFGAATAAAGTLCYLFYNSLAKAVVIDFQNGLFFGFAEVALMDLAARATPAGCEGLGFSLIMSVRNLSLFGADKLGAYYSDTYHVKWNTMVIINAATTAIVLIILPFMPKAIMRSRDR